MRVNRVDIQHVLDDKRGTNISTHTKATHKLHNLQARAKHKTSPPPNTRNYTLNNMLLLCE